ncbi:hypothetical protein [Methylobacterium sp. E-045]|uniref:hypothetical protein n=1 Tax=Methylobacterium sp. E-045 TaxID=2836575 RepID=UPI001FB899FF|nr:hypothetical protein [Methylobacterium sp. E-045]MCJ2129225.1 hypothetical protein [Methylobacterium sp. E-045]
MSKLIGITSAAFLCATAANAQSSRISASDAVQVRKYSDTELQNVREILKFRPDAANACAIRLYKYGRVTVVTGFPISLYAATLVYVDANQKLTSGLGEYVVPTDAESRNAPGPYIDGGTDSWFRGQQKEVFFNFNDLPSELTLDQDRHNERERTITITTNWRVAHEPTPADIDRKCGPEARYCECVYQFPR